MLVTILIALLAALLAVGLAELLTTFTRAPAWLVEIVKLAALLVAFAWLGSVLG